jgi:hypothetical protein
MTDEEFCDDLQKLIDSLQRFLPGLTRTQLCALASFLVDALEAVDQELDRCPSSTN